MFQIIMAFAAAMGLLAVGLYTLPACHGKEITTYHCVPASVMMGNGSAYTLATHDQLMFLRAGFITQANTPDDMPPGDKAYLMRIGDNMKVVFVDGDMACASMILFKGAAEAVDQIGRGEINHTGKTL